MLAVQVTIDDVEFVIDYCCENLSAFISHTIKDSKLSVANPVTPAEHGSIAIYLNAGLLFPKMRICSSPL